MGTVTQRTGGTTWRVIRGLFTSSQDGAQKAMSIAKPSEVTQRETESPPEFCERLCEDYGLYSPIDPARGCWVSDGDKCSLWSLAYPENVRWGDTK